MSLHRYRKRVSPPLCITKQPTRVTNGDGGGSIEEVMVLLITRFSHAHPHLGGLLPFVPWPPQPKSPCKLVDLEHPKPSKLKKQANNLPIHLALAPVVLSEPDHRKALSSLLTLRRMVGGMTNRVAG